MRTFDFHAPTSLPETLDLLDRYGEDAHLMAGATALVLMLKQGLVSPAHVVGISRVPELQGIHTGADGGLELRALVTHRQAETSEAVRQYCPALADTFSKVATVRIRNQATVGGNLAHADPAQDPPPMLMALDAEVVIASRTGERRLPLSDLFVDYFETALQPGEVLASVELPPLAHGTRATYVKFLPRTADDYATVAVAAVLRQATDGAVEDVRIGVGAAGPIPIRARAAEEVLRGEQPTDERLREAAALVRDAVDPIADERGSASYKREMARVWTERALRSLLSGGASANGRANGVHA